MESRLAELELKLNLAEDAVDVLNRTVFRQQQQLDLLQAQMRELYRQLLVTDAGHPSAQANPLDEIPPHY